MPRVQVECWSAWAAISPRPARRRSADGRCLSRTLAGADQGCGMSDQILWYATRGAGAVSLVLLTGVLVLGIAGALRWQTPGWPRFLTTSFHRNLALLSLVFLAVHIVTAVVDPFTALGWTAAVIPFLSPYRRLWLGLGVVATDLLLAVAVTSSLRRMIGHRTWRLIH